MIFVINLFWSLFKGECVMVNLWDVMMFEWILCLLLFKVYGNFDVVFVVVCGFYEYLLVDCDDVDFFV